MIIIGELINGTREAVRRAIVARDEAAIAELAIRQTEAGANYLDCNVGTVGEAEVEQMAWLVGVVSAAVDAPVCIDTASPDAMRVGLAAWQGTEPPICNSVTLERGRLDVFLPIIAGRHARVVALLMTDECVPQGVEARVDAARRLVEVLEGAGVARDDILIDPIVTPLSVDADGARVTMDAIAEIMSALPGCHTVCGVSNVSYGLPARGLLNRVFLCQAIRSGLDAAIIDPLDRQLMADIYAAEALAGRDEWCAKYLQAYRSGVL